MDMKSMEQMANRIEEVALITGIRHVKISVAVGQGSQFTADIAMCDLVETIHQLQDLDFYGVHRNDAVTPKPVTPGEAAVKQEGE